MLLFVVARILLFAPVIIFPCTAQTSAEQAEGQASQTPLPSPSFQQRPAVPVNSPLYQDMDLLRRRGFAAAEEASVSLRVVDKQGVTPANLQVSDFTLIVNGTRREARLHAPGSGSTAIPPVVLLVFPPNQPAVHYIAVKQATQYFSQQPTEMLPWKVGLFDSNGKLLPFTNGRSQLLAYLDVVDHTTEPFQYSSDAGLPARFRWEGSWLTRVNEAIGLMQSYEGPKVILAMNPLSESTYGLNDQILAHDGPEDLTPAAQRIGAHVYIANVGGPDTLVPLGDAAEDQAAQRNTPGDPVLGSTPSYHMQVDPRETAALNGFAYRTSEMMQTAAATLGGFANSLNDLAAQIHHDLDGNYSLDFDLTPEDRDRGIPDVGVKIAPHDPNLANLKVAILDIVPIGVTAESARALSSQQITDLLARAAKHPVLSPDFHITQRVDYFPVRGGLEPVLPMSSVVEWTGMGRGPSQLSIAESVEDTTLSNTVLQREINVHWNGHSLTWERDGQLRPGDYVWRIAVHDGSGKILSSAEEKIDVAYPRQSSMEMSSLVLGKSCRKDSESATGLQRRPTAGSDDKEKAHPLIDPMRADGCRLQPEATSRFTSTDTLRAFVRIYPDEKLEKRHRENWTAEFVLRSKSGTVETDRAIPFAVDSGSGYLAAIELPLDTRGISAGLHTLDVAIHGSGAHGDLKRSRQLWIAGPDNAPDPLR
jgi:hypothetical protein